MHSSENDKVTVVGGGVTLHEAIKAYETLKNEKINIRVIDPFTLKPIDKDLLVKSALATGGNIITVEDHYPEGTQVYTKLFKPHSYVTSDTHCNSCRWTW